MPVISAYEVEAGGSGAQGQPGLQEALLLNKDKFFLEY